MPACYLDSHKYSMTVYLKVYAPLFPSLLEVANVFVLQWFCIKSSTVKGILSLQPVVFTSFRMPVVVLLVFENTFFPVLFFFFFLSNLRTVPFHLPLLINSLYHCPK